MSSMRINYSLTSPSHQPYVVLDWTLSNISPNTPNDKYAQAEQDCVAGEAYAGDVSINHKGVLLD